MRSVSHASCSARSDGGALGPRPVARLRDAEQLALQGDGQCLGLLGVRDVPVDAHRIPVSCAKKAVACLRMSRSCSKRRRSRAGAGAAPRARRWSARRRAHRDRARPGGASCAASAARPPGTPRRPGSSGPDGPAPAPPAGTAPGRQVSSSAQCPSLPRRLRRKCSGLRKIGGIPIRDPLGDPRQQPVVVDMPKVVTDVGLEHKPVPVDERPTQHLLGVRGRPARP